MLGLNSIHIGKKAPDDWVTLTPGLQVSEWLNLTAFLGTADSEVHLVHTVKPVCNDHFYNEMYYLWFIH